MYHYNKNKEFFGKIHKFKNNITFMFIQSDDKELFRKIWNKIIELIGINNGKGFAKNTRDDDADEFIMVDVHKNTSFAEGIYRDKLVIFYILSSIIILKHH